MKSDKPFEVGDTIRTGEHVGEMLSGYIDGELTQQQRQRVEIHCESCAACAGELLELGKLREEIGAAKLSAIGEDAWRETMSDSTVRTSRGIGWLLLVFIQECILLKMYKDKLMLRFYYQ